MNPCSLGAMQVGEFLRISILFMPFMYWNWSQLILSCFGLCHSKFLLEKGLTDCGGSWTAVASSMFVLVLRYWEFLLVCSSLGGVSGVAKSTKMVFFFFLGSTTLGKIFCADNFSQKKYHPSGLVLYVQRNWQRIYGLLSLMFFGVHWGCCRGWLMHAFVGKYRCCSIWCAAHLCLMWIIWRERERERGITPYLTWWAVCFWGEVNISILCMSGWVLLALFLFSLL